MENSLHKQNRQYFSFECEQLKILELNLSNLKSIAIDTFIGININSRKETFFGTKTFLQIELTS